MDNKTSIRIFQDIKVRSVWNDNVEKWYFSVIDIVAILTEQTDYKKAQSYWTTLKSRLKKEGSEIVTKCDKLKLMAADGKKYLTDVSPCTLRPLGLSECRVNLETFAHIQV